MTTTDDTIKDALKEMSAVNMTLRDIVKYYRDKNVDITEGASKHILDKIEIISIAMQKLTYIMLDNNKNIKLDKTES